jgi:hypothetical protein
VSEIELWRKYLPLITGHSREVAAIPEFYHCLPSHGNLSLSPIGGGRLTLGMLLKLKVEFDLDIECRCGARDFFALNLGGSLLSGRHKFFGLCKACRHDFSGTDPRKFGKFALRAYDLRRQNELPAYIEPLTLLQVVWEIASTDERQNLEVEYNELPSLTDRTGETEPGGLTVRNKRLPPGLF